MTSSMENYRLPPVELLKAVHSFPGPYLFKVIGHVEDDFVGRVQSCVREELKLTQAPRCSTRYTASGKQVAVTVEALVTDAPQIHDVYRRLMTLPGLVVLL